MRGCEPHYSHLTKIGILFPWNSYSPTIEEVLSIIILYQGILVIHWSSMCLFYQKFVVFPSAVGL